MSCARKREGRNRLAGRGPQSFKKRQKEQQRKEKQQEKLARRLQRKHEKHNGGADTEPIDHDPEHPSDREEETIASSEAAPS